ncbi:MAG: hypothetical protein RID53_32240 [Coleofasciculus sp. B1-GNL1-01]|uniref:hypothetical protein n=1 Tax=Coleofasciculus sp. B1-GNL1-01 TaxID=3068484 RepID=UPI003301BC23
MQSLPTSLPKRAIRLSITATINNGLGSIDTTSGAYNSTSAGGNGGDINLSTNQGGISTSNLSSFSESDGTIGGNIDLSNGMTRSICPDSSLRSE